MKKIILPGLFAALVISGCATHEKRTAHVSRTDTTYNSPTYDRVLSESRTYSPASEDIAASISQRDKSSSTTVSAGATADATASVSDSDRSLETKVREALTTDSSFGSAAPNVQVKVEGGKVVLSGNVESEQQKQMAATIVQNTTGVVSVDNRLSIGSSTSTLTTPSPTSSSEESRIYSNTNSSNIDVNAPKASEPQSEQKNDQSSIQSQSTTTRAEVAGETSSAKGQGKSDDISGVQTGKSSESDVAISTETKTSESAASQTAQADIQLEKSEAEKLSPTSDRSDNRVYSTDTSKGAPADTTTGVSGTQSSTSTSPSTSDTSTTAGTQNTQSALVTEVRQAITADTTLSASLPNIQISEDGGKVTLRGKVKSEQEKKDIEALVQKTTGVTSVDNQLEISTSP
jgi:osmotically-inducible protein OsmY